MTTSPALRPDPSQAIESADASRWTVDQLRFQTWLALPKELRRPSTQAELAEEMRYDDSTLSRWKVLPGFGAAVSTMAKEWMRSEDVALILRSQAKVATSEIPFASTQAAQLVLTALGEMPRVGGDVNVQVNNTVYDTGLPTPD